MTDELPTGWKRNPSLGPAILAACEEDGMGWYGQWRVARALRRLSDADWAKLERKCTALATEAGLPMGTNDIVADCYVGEWGDGTFFQMLIDSLPKILEFIKALLPLFMLFATLLLCCGLFAGTASAQCSGGTCGQEPQIALAPHTDYVAVTIADDAAAKRFWRVAVGVACQGKRCDSLQKIYAQYGRQHARDDTVYVDRVLWDHRIGRDTFGQHMLRRVLRR